jgi:hypothetical protein
MLEKSISKLIENLLKKYFRKEKALSDSIQIMTYLYLNEDDGYYHRQIVIDFQTKYKPIEKPKPKEENPYYI